MRATPWSRARAASMSASVGAVAVAMTLIAGARLKSGTGEPEDLVHDLSYGGERVELAALDLVQQPPKLRVVADRFLQVGLRPRRRDREDLAGEVAPPPLLQLARVLEVRFVRLDLGPQLVDVLAAHRLRQHDRRPPGA